MDVVDPADRGPGRFSQLHPVIIHTAGELGVWVSPALAGAALVCLFLSLKFWQFGLTKYQSTGS